MPDATDVCPVCGGSLRSVFRKHILSRYFIEYFECSGCELVTTEDPYWLDEAYSSAISNLDTGLVQRNIQMSEFAASLIVNHFNPTGVFLDFAGGYGLFVRLMRDKGFNFYWRDKYCKNIFASFFSHSDSMASYDLVTAFELFEHLSDPQHEMEELANITDTILLTTQIRPSSISEVEQWWYLVPETGQHITFYSLQALRRLAEQVGMKLYTDGQSTHIISAKRSLPVFERQSSSPGALLKRVAKRIGRLAALEPRPEPMMESLIWSDHQTIKEALRSKLQG